MVRAGGGGCDLHVGQTLGRGVPPGLVEQDREDILERGALVAALGEGAAPAQHEQRAAALAHEVGDHLELAVGEEAGLDRTQDEGAVAVEVFAGGREAFDEFERVVEVAAEELVLGGALQEHDLQVLVGGHGAKHEGYLVARFALEVEDLLGAVADLHDRVQHVVLQDPFALLARDAEGEFAGAGGLEGDGDGCDQRLSIGRQRNHFGGDDRSHVLDHDRDVAAGVPGRLDDDVDDGRGAGERAFGHVGAGGLDVGLHLLVAQPDGEDRHRRGAQRQQRLADGLVAVVAPVRQHDDPRQRHPLQLVAGVGQRVADPGLAAVECERVNAADPAWPRREAEMAECEFLAEGAHQLALGVQ